MNCTPASSHLNSSNLLRKEEIWPTFGKKDAKEPKAHPPLVTSQRWKRPLPPTIDSSRDPLVFQQIDIDHCVGSVIPNMPGAQCGPVPILRMFGVTMEGHSVCAHIHGFLPYFYIPVPDDSFSEEHCATLRQELNRAILKDLRSNREGVQEAVLAVEICQKCSIYGFYFNKMSRFLHITVALPRLVAPARRLVSEINIPPFGQRGFQVYIC